jgi:coenzyme F420-reducing hydrogenase beta subunit
MIDITIKNKKDCMACFACYNICQQNAISMNSDNEGFSYPKVDYNKCIKCELCIKVCPTINNVKVYQKDVKAYACINKDDSIRLRSSSGGIFTLISERILNRRGVVFGAGFDKDFKVVHSYIEKDADIKKLRGSKYVQSKIEDTYKQAKDFLEKGKEVFFTGTPCQIAGLKRYLAKNYDNLLCQDIICQGVPSPLVWESYLKCRIKSQGGYQPTKITFRSKDESWKQYKMKIHFESGDSYQKSKNEDNFLKSFMNFISIRPSCFECKFKGENRESDLTLGDFWGIQNIEPSMNDNKGTSLVLINNIKGQKILNEIRDKMIYKEVNFTDAIKSNPMYIKSIPSNNYDLRNSFFKDLQSSNFDTVAKKYLKEPMLIILKRKAKRIYYALKSNM